MTRFYKKHESVFTEGLGAFTGGQLQVTLHVNPQVKPKFFKVRTLPISIKDKVAEELETLGIITPVKITQWAAAVVLVLRNNGTMRLCGDYIYRVSINQASKVAFTLIKLLHVYYYTLVRSACISNNQLLSNVYNM